MGFEVIQGDCLDVMRGMAAASVDAVVCDPPYEFGFMGRGWDKAGVSFKPETWAEVLRVLKDGGRMMAFGGTRTSHRMVCAIEDAGFVIEDTVMWLYGSGFPKHKSKLKPAYEPVTVARKGHSSALNIDACRIATNDDLSGRTYGGIFSASRNPDGSLCKAIGSGDKGRWPANVILDEEAARALDLMSGERKSGLLPSHQVHRTQKNCYGKPTQDDTGRVWGGDSGGASRFFYCAKASRAERERGLEGMPLHPAEFGTGGSKRINDPAAKEARGRKPVVTPPSANHHPTVKPISLMAYLCRLVTPEGGTILDPFCGSGSTGVAAIKEGFNFIGIEREGEYVEIARRRINHSSAAQPPLFAENVA